METSPYSAFAHVYDKLTKIERRRHLAGEIANLTAADNVTSTRVIDLGCGTGNLLQILADRGINCVGIDASAEMISVANTKIYGPGQVQFLCMDLLDLPNHSFSADVVVATSFVLSYLTENHLIAKAFDVAFNNLRPGGTFIFDMLTENGVEQYFTETRSITNEDEWVDLKLEYYNYDSGRYQLKYTIQHNGRSQFEIHLGRILPPKQLGNLADKAGFVSFEYKARTGDNLSSKQFGFQAYCRK